MDGRVLLRPVDGSGGLGIERNDTTTVDGFPGLNPRQLGEAVLVALATVWEIPRHEHWSATSAYAAPLLSASPTG
ncbi:MAG: hypothetical protein ACRDZ8_06250 [Acidimicrobiales bacterium]